MAKSRQSNAVMTFKARNYFAHFACFAWRRRNEKQGILEIIFIISNKGGHRNGKKSFLPVQPFHHKMAKLIQSRNFKTSKRHTSAKSKRPHGLGIFAWAPETRFTR
jgi:hypothetical protein